MEELADMIAMYSSQIREALEGCGDLPHPSHLDDWLSSYREKYAAEMNTDHLSLANKITKALFPDLYGKPGLSTGQVALLMGSRGIILETLERELPKQESTT